MSLDSLITYQTNLKAMPHWLIKSAIHRTISWLPCSHEWNYFLQKKLSRSLEPSSGSFTHMAEDSAKFLDYFAEHSTLADGRFTAFELGTGWFPTVPIALFLCGAEQVWTADISPLLKIENVRHVLKFYQEEGASGHLAKLLPRLRPERMKHIGEALDSAETDPVKLLATLNIGVLVLDARTTGLKAESVDLVISDSVLVHVPQVILYSIFEEFRRIISPQGVMVHWMGLWDTYARFDQRLTRFNMLRYSEKSWRIYNSPMEHQNRMRMADFRKLHGLTGFDLVAEECLRAAPEELDKVTLHADFLHMNREDLLVMSCWQASVPR